MRLAIALGRTVRELEETMGADEWDDWLDFERHYDLPDAFLITAQLGTLIAKITGNSHIAAARMAPYYTIDPTSPKGVRRKAAAPGLAGAFAFLRANVKPDGKSF